MNRFCHILLILLGLLFSGTAYCQEIRDSVKIYFRQGYSILDPSIEDNQAKLNRIADSLATSYADSIYQLKNVVVIGGASPEGSVPLNKRLSERRANVLFNYLSRYGILAARNKKFIYLGRDWHGLLELVRADVNVPYRDEVIDLIEDIIVKQEDNARTSQDGHDRLINLRDGEPYKYMYRELFPELRASRVVLSYEKVFNPNRLDPVAHGIGRPVVGYDAMDPEMASIPMKKPLRPFFMAIKSNMLTDAVLLPNIGVEFYLGGNTSIAANWTYAWWKSDNVNWYSRNYGGDIALRVWLGRRAKEKPLTGHHIGVYGQVLTYDFLVGKTGYIAGKPGGDIFDRANVGVGLEYGYSLPVARRLNIDFSLGVGYLWGEYYEYTPVDDCYVWQATKKHHYAGPTKAEISLVWLLGRNNINIGKGGKR